MPSAAYWLPRSLQMEVSRMAPSILIERLSTVAKPMLRTVNVRARPCFIVAAQSQA